MASPLLAALRSPLRPTVTAPSGVTAPSRVRRALPRDPRWARWCLFGLLAGTAVLYLWSLGDPGWANASYSAAARAGATSWSAWFFGASDAPGLIMVDKPRVT
ncbi:hypothetical protein [Actinomycetospora chibensis]|uniref:Uncharacterized protein n=1 Tax=Actinomycetospora chibensis TaxID=663606 RepID=A0ABV9RDW7_9PSEU